MRTGTPRNETRTAGAADFTEVEGVEEVEEMFPMGLLTDGESAEVVECRGFAAEGPAAAGGHQHRPGCRGCSAGGRAGAASRLEDLGIRAGKVIEMLSNEGRGTLLVKVDESRIAVGRAAAMKIMVRRKDDEPCDA